MSESLFPTFCKIGQTPLRDMLRLRVTGRLDWKSQLAAAGLPAQATELITRVVKRTRLFRLEKAAVANELIAHFQDGLAAGTTVLQMVERFGDERTAAKLIRRAKRRGRPVLWHIWNFIFQVTATLIAIYAVLLILFCVEKPEPSVDYLAKLNEPILRSRPEDRAWPLWERAVLAASDGMNDGQPVWSDSSALGNQAKVSLDELAGWTRQHQQAIDLAYAAAQKPVLGFILGPDGSLDDQKLFPANLAHKWDNRSESLVSVPLPHLNFMNGMGVILSDDARLAGARGDGRRVESDLLAILGLARQLKEADGFLVTQMVGSRVRQLAVWRLQAVILNHPSLLSDDQLIGLAHSIAGGQVAADLIKPLAARFVFDDRVQRIYTDNGRGDGHMTLQGLGESDQLSATTAMGRIAENGKVIFASTVPMGVASRAELTRKYNELMDETEANFSLPSREVDFDRIDGEISKMKNSAVDQIRYAMLLQMIPRLNRVQTMCEEDLGMRDGTLVAIGLEIFHRHRGRYPSSLAELTPEFLPVIPADRITGEPVRYRLIDGKPAIYSVGADRVDDGGKPTEKEGHPDERPVSVRDRAAQWGIKPEDAPRGDWVLYPPVGAEDN